MNQQLEESFRISKEKEVIVKEVGEEKWTETLVARGVYTRRLPYLA